jgi:hypothetical protein
MKCTAKLEKIIMQFVDANHPQTRPDGDKWVEAFDEDDVGYIKGDPEYKYYDLSYIDLFNDTYTTLHFSEGKIYSLFFKEEMVKDGLGWIIKVPMTPTEIQAERTRQQGWYRY